MNSKQCTRVLILLSVLATPVGAFEWQIFPVDTGAKPALDIQPFNDYPHIAFMTEDIPGFVRHGKWNGSNSFDITEAASGYFYGPLDIVIVGDLSPHILFHDHQGTSFDPSRGDQIHAFQPSEFSDFWISQPIADDGHDGWDVSAAVFEGRVHTASIDPAQFGSAEGVEYWDSDNVEAIGSGPIDYEFGTSIAMDAQGNPHISYFDYAKQPLKSETLKYAKRLNGVWRIETVDDQSGAGRYSSIRIDSNGQPAISYYASDATSGIIRYAKLVNGTWQTEEVDRIEIVPVGPTGARNLTSLDYDPSGNAVISYASFQEVKIAVKTAAGWLTETVVAEPQTGRFIGGLTSLRVDRAGTAHIAYYQFDQSLFNQGLGIPTGTVFYARGLSANRAPILTLLTSATVDEGSPLSLSFEASDPDQDDLSITAQGLPEGAVLDGTTIKWTPGFSQAGSYQVTIVASDGTNETSQMIEIIVGNVNAPVRFAGTTPSKAILIASAGENLLFNIDVIDEDGDIPTISWSLNGQTLEGETGTTLSIPSTTADQDIVVVTASDGESTVTHTWTVARTLSGDFDGSGTVDFTDFLTFAEAFGQTVESGAAPIIDIDGSGVIDFADFLIFASFFGVSI